MSADSYRGGREPDVSEREGIGDGTPQAARGADSGSSRSETSAIRPRALPLIVQDMEHWADKGHGDPEIAHYEADKLLREAVERLARYATDTEDEGETSALLNAWDRVRKWYA